LIAAVAPNRGCPRARYEVAILQGDELFRSPLMITADFPGNIAMATNAGNNPFRLQSGSHELRIESAADGGDDDPGITIDARHERTGAAFVFTGAGNGIEYRSNRAFVLRRFSGERERLNVNHY